MRRNFVGKTSLFKFLRKAISEAQENIKNKTDAEAALEDKISNQSRRSFVKKSILTTGMIGVTPFLNSCEKLNLFSLGKNERPIVIIGAGAAGLAAAYTLKKAGLPYVIYEGSSRVGGRIFTRESFNQDKQFIEAGAELVDTNHQALIGLANELGLTIEDFAPFDKGYEEECFYYKNRLYKRADLVKSIKTLVERTNEVAKKIKINSELMAQYDRMSLKEYLEKGSKFTDKWVLKMIEVAFIGELGSELEFISSYTFISIFAQEYKNNGEGFSMFGESDESKRVKGGNSQLIYALHKNVDHNGAIKLDHQLMAIKEKGANLMLSLKNNSKIIEVEASRVIIALPLTTLRNVEGILNLNLTPAKKQFISEMQYGTNTKLIVGYKSRFWRQSHPKIPASNGSIFGDFSAQSFWETSRLQNGNSGIITNFSGGNFGKNLRKEDMDKVLKDYTHLYSEVPNQLSGDSFLMNWSRYPWNFGSYACYGPGQYTRFAGTGKEPELNGRLHFAGEHTSDDFQGFMNGAYESGIRAAQNILKVKS
jgi:monoamine oxidase